MKSSILTLSLLLAVTGNAPPVQRGQKALKNGDYKQAIESYKKQLESAPKHFKALFGLARAYAYSGKRKKAIATYTEVLEHHPESISALLGRARVHMWNEDYDKSKRDLDRAKQISPDSGSLWHTYGDYYRFTGDYDKAYESYSKWIEISPLSAKAHLLRAEAGYYAASVGKVRQDLEKAAELGASDEDIQSIRRKLAAPSGKWEASAKYSYTNLEDEIDFQSWHTFSAKLSRSFEPISFSLKYLGTRRFEQKDHAAVLTSYFGLWSSAYGSLRLHGSGQEVGVLADFDVMGAIYQSLGAGFELSGSYRYLYFSDPGSELWGLNLAKYYGNWYFVGSLGLNSTGPNTLSYSTAARYYYDSADDYVELSVSVGDTQLGPQLGTIELFTKETFSYGVSAKVQRFFTQRWGGSAGISYSYYEQVANRLTLSVGTTYRW